MNAPGDLIDGRFELVEPLGTGGMGTVWRAHDTVLHRHVALKAVRPDAAASEAVRERVLREARALARLNHPNVVTVHHIVDVEPHPWIVMELVPGMSLQDRLDQGSLTPVEAAGLGRQMLSALHAAHTAGIRHRDIKPPNILLRPDGTAVLTDFGIAALHDATSLTMTGELIGSPEYMAPERIRGHGDEPASDLWSLGLVLYVCVEGVSPLRRDTALSTLAAVLDDPVPSPHRSGPLAPVLESLLVRDPTARPDAARLDSMLAEVESGRAARWDSRSSTAVAPRPPADHPPTLLNAPGPPPDSGARNRNRNRNRTKVVVAVAAVLALAAGTVLFLNLPGDSGDAKKTAGGGSSGSPASEVSAPSTSSGPKPSPSNTGGPTASPSGSASSDTPVADRWIAQLFSEPVSSGTAARDKRLAAVRESVPDATVVRSDEYASLTPGYWVIYAPGPFTDGAAALAYCAEHGRTTGSTCIGRYLSRSPNDFALQCHPPVTAPTGRCTRS
ncbi:serine/threonine-protein kinase [Streptomyces sp. NPDC127072]|uniref:serine/threonine-protein kinase n=1 Tax=Streptomyces sp. NPDC127072 TaxID=3347129 RepID=UPI00365F363F